MSLDFSLEGASRVALVAATVVGHACFWTAILNDVYGRALPKPLLKIWRITTGLNILGFTVAALIGLAGGFTWPVLAEYYAVVVCLPMALIVFPIAQLRMGLRPRAPAVISERTVTIDYWPRLQQTAIGDGHYAWCPRVPFNCVFQVDFSEISLKLAGLPPVLDGVQILFLSDLHFHGTPSRLFWESLFGDLAAQAMPDIIALGGDFVDGDEHFTWIEPLLQKLKFKDHGVAVLGNHDWHHHPDQVRAALRHAGYQDIGNTWWQGTLRGLPVQWVGHEGPWFTPGPVSREPDQELLRLCLSHTPDNFPWAIGQGCRLTLSGHVHGGGIRLPLLGPIFIPSIYGRRFDMGVFQEGDSVMVVSRGLSGKEPLRFRCHPQVVRLTLVA